MRPSDKTRLQRHDFFYAQFCPKKMDTVKPSCAAYIGMVAKWQAAWVCDDCVYDGQWACVVANEDPWVKCHSLPFSWVPDEDLEILKWCY